MAMRKAAGCVVVALLVYSVVDYPLPSIFQHFGSDLPSPTHQIVRRNALPNSTEYEVELIVEILDLASFKILLASIPFPVTLNNINNTLRIASVNITTECSPTPSGQQCTCADDYAFSSDNCQSGSACDGIIGGRCGCISSLPANGQYCELNTTSTEEKLGFIMNLVFKSSYNDPANDFYQDVLNKIQTEFRKHIPNAQVRNLTFRSGSTIAEYTVVAAFPDPEVIETAKVGLFRELSTQYPMIFDSPIGLAFDPPKVFNGKSLRVSCGPPPDNLNFTSGWTAQWKLDNVEIREDAQHSFSVVNNIARLDISKTFATDNGVYECRLTSTSGSVFRQRAEFTLTPVPQIVVSPVKEKFASSQTVMDQVTIGNCGDTETFTCEEVSYPEFRRVITVETTGQSFTCVDDPVFGNGLLNDTGRASCAANEVGEITATCNSSGLWGNREDTCVLRIINDLLEQSEILNSISLPAFLEEVSNQVAQLSDEVSESPNNLNATVAILQNIGELALSGAISLNERTMTDFLKTSSILTDNKAKNSWDVLNEKATMSVTRTRQSVTPSNESTSSLFLFSIESVARVLTNGSFSISTDNIVLDKTTFANTFSADFNSTVEIDLQESNGGTNSLTVINFASMDNVLPARDEANSSLTVINGNVVIVQSSGSVDNISFTFDVRNTSLGRPQCVFWNFSLFDRLGGWDDEGCELVTTVNGTVTCNCNHLTAFSMLMSPFIPENLFLEIMTYIGVAISIACLVICLIIEAYAWKRMKLKDLTYLRHVCIVNIAVSLLIADIWFIIGAAVSESAVTTEGTCSTVAFFIHLFYLALFFWMLLFGILLLKSMVTVFDTGSSKRSKLAIGFSLGYGAPLLIAVITIAVTAPNKEYLAAPRACWLNFYQSKALLAFVIPALTIVAVNLVILIYVLFKLLLNRNTVVGDSAHGRQRSDIVVIVRTVAVLSPFFGLTWSLGVGTMVDPLNFGVHAAFAFFNSLQGFFILVFGTLWDKKVRKELGLRSTSSMSTRNTTSGTSSSGLLGRLRRRGRGVIEWQPFQGVPTATALQSE
ncbi:adhesion G protein-coupled receptor F4-like [Neosynchiropus ocellatus]